MVENIHTRILKATIQEVGSLIDRLASREDTLWPSNRWPAMRFDRPLGVGAVGGHGPIRYFVESYEPGRSITFRFTSPKGYVGIHALDVKEVEPGAVQLRHVLKMRMTGLTRLTWPLAFRWLHDALVEDAFDRAEAYCTSSVLSERSLSMWVRILRHLMSSKGARVFIKRRTSAAVQK
jgi:hypothetical protein